MPETVAQFAGLLQRYGPFLAEADEALANRQYHLVYPSMEIPHNLDLPRALQTANTRVIECFNANWSSLDELDGPVVAYLDHLCEVFENIHHAHAAALAVFRASAEKGSPYTLYLRSFSQVGTTVYESEVGRAVAYVVDERLDRNVAAALRRFQRSGEPYAGSTDPRTAGNGSIMRLAPIPMFFYLDIAAAEHYAAESSRTTHGAAECLDACRLLARILCRALQGRPRAEVAFGDAGTFVGAEKIVAIARGAYRDKAEGAIRGSGYVVESLEAALWCFTRSASFEEAILMAANLGDDADTTAAVCGQVAGAYYGEGGIPGGWLGRLAMREEIGRLAERLHGKKSEDRAEGKSTTPNPETWYNRGAGRVYMRIGGIGRASL